MAGSVAIDVLTCVDGHAVNHLDDLLLRPEGRWDLPKIPGRNEIRLPRIQHPWLRSRRNSDPMRSICAWDNENSGFFNLNYFS